MPQLSFSLDPTAEGVLAQMSKELELVLVVDDDASGRAELVALLGRADYRVVEGIDGRDALRRFYERRPDLVLLTVSLRGLDGFQVLARIRDLSDVPVLMLTDGDALDTVRSLRNGADDSVGRPFRDSELIARISSLLRRAPQRAEPAWAYSDGVLSINFGQPEVKLNGERVALTPVEFKLLVALVRHSNQVLTREQLLDLVWGSDWVSTAQVKNYIGYLRRKLGSAVEIETIRGFGYRFRPAVFTHEATEA